MRYSLSSKRWPARRSSLERWPKSRGCRSSTIAAFMAPRATSTTLFFAPAGVFVVDAKNVRGTIEIRNAGYFWQKDYRLFVGRRDKTSYIEGFDWQIAAVKTALEVGGIEPLPSITPVLCFINGDWPFFRAPERYGDVRIEGPRSIKKLLTASTVLDTDGIDRIARVLAAQLPAK